MDIWFLILAAVLLAVDFSISKLYQAHFGTSLRSGMRYSMLKGLFGAAIFFVIGGFSFHITLFSAVMAVGMSLLCLVYTLLGFRILREGSMALYTLFLMTGGMTAPYVWGLVFLDEPFRWLRLLGLLLIAASVVLSNTGDKKPTRTAILLCTAVFFLNGCVSVFSKCHQVASAFAHVSAVEFVMLTDLVQFFVSGLYLLFSHFAKKESPTEKVGKTSLAVLLVVLSALIGGVSYYFQLRGAENLPASMLYPFVSGGSILLSTLAGILFFKEKPSKRLIIGVFVCLIGTCLFL